MTLRNRVQTIERRAGAAVKDPAEMTVAELCDEIIQAVAGDRDRLHALLAQLPDDVLQRQLEAIQHAIETAQDVSLISPPDWAALLRACAGAKSA